MKKNKYNRIYKNICLFFYMLLLPLLVFMLFDISKAAINEIYTIEDLYRIRNGIFGSYILMKDLDFDKDSDYANPNDTSFGDINGNGTTEGIKTELTTGKGWIPIGRGNQFYGNFNGNNYKIKGLYINRDNENNTGLFSHISGEIINTHVYANKVIGAECTGILTGLNYGVIDKCSTSGYISADKRAGGLVGLNTGIVNECYSVSKVIARADRAGGLIAHSYTDSSIVKNSYAIGEVIAENSNPSGLIAHLIDGEVFNCYSTSLINSPKSSSHSAGIIGDDYGTVQKVYGCIAMTPKIIANSVSNRVGNLNNTPLVNRYKNFAYDNMKISSDGGKTFYNIPPENAENDTSYQGKNISLDEFKSNEFYETEGLGWDFDNVWEILSGATRPTLINNPDGLGIDYPDGLGKVDRKNFKYYVVKGDKGNPIISLVSKTGLDANFERADILDSDNNLKSGVYYIDDNGAIRKYNKYYNFN